MINFLLSSLGIILTIFFVVGTHEFAHFLVARWLGVKVLRFSIGFGKALWRWHDKKQTEYVLALIPLGGYVKMLDEREEPVSKKDLRFAFNRQPFYKKCCIVLAGPVTNILCALILYWLIFVIGFVTVRPMIGTISPRSIAAEAGLKGNQEIIQIDGKNTPTLMSVMLRLLTHAGDQDHLKIEVRPLDGKAMTTHVLDLSNWHMNELTPDPLNSLGISPYEPPIPLIIGYIAPKSPAATTALQLGDKLIAINKLPIKNWDELIKTIMHHPADNITLTIERRAELLTIPVTLSYHRNLFLQKSGYLGIGPNFQFPTELLHKIQYGPITAMTHACQQVVDLTYLNILLFGKMLTGKVSLQSLGGPITIFDSAGDALNSGFLSFIGFLAFLSISIGIINLFPIPGLDGGHLFIQIIELVIRRPIPLQLLFTMYRIGFALLIFVLIQSLVNDVLRMY